MDTPEILLAGDSAVSVQFGDAISPAIYDRVRALNQQLKAARLPGIIETIPTFRSLMVQYDPLRLPYDALVSALGELMSHTGSADAVRRKVITLPVCFGGPYGEDLESVAEYHHTTPEAIVEKCCSADLLIYMLGFTPGYPYIGGMPDGLATPRLDSPRVKVPAGAVGIGGEQLGIYPLESPGGFRLIGNTPVRLYDPDRKDRTVLLEAGEYIRFQAVSPEEYDIIRRQVEAGTYTCQIKEG